MSARQTWFVIVLTLFYLCVELAFNARLLDVVGAGASEEQLDAIEVFGRTLSGVALALFVLQFCLARRHASGSGRPGVLATLFWCVVAGSAVFFSLHALVDYLVDDSSPEFRKTSVSILLLQRALVTGDMALDGINDDPALFSKPEGKAFLGLFPLMAISIDKLDEKIRAAKLELIARTVEEDVEGPGGYYAQYEAARKSVHQEWQRYEGIPKVGDVDETVARRQDAAWGDYLSSLGKRGWLPSTVPPAYHDNVRKNVRKKVPVARDWDLTDESAFREAVAVKVRRAFGKGDGSVMVDGRRIEAGLDWPAFFAHPAVQAKLRHKLGLPPAVRVLANYRSGDEFQRAMFAPMVRKQAQAQLARYDAPADTYADGAGNGTLGTDSARAVIVPPVALFFSLMGAILHVAKLCYLLAALSAHALPAVRRRAGYLWLAPAAALCTLLAMFSVKDNAVTESRLYHYMQGQMLARSGDAGTAPLRDRLRVHALHMVAVGQAWSYPGNEMLRMRVLRGFNFGYQHEKK